MPTQLTLEEMKVRVRQHFEAFVNQERPEVIHENMTADFQDHDGPRGTEVGADEDERMMRQMYKWMPGIQVTIEAMVAEEDKVVCRNAWR